MAAAPPGQDRTFWHRMRPAWRLPMLTAGTPKVGVSTTPELELPATSAAYCMAERYRRSPRLCTKPARCGWAAANACMAAVHTAPPASALEPVMSQNTPGTAAMAVHSAAAWAAASGAPGAVSGWKVTSANGCMRSNPVEVHNSCRLILGRVRMFSSPKPPTQNTVSGAWPMRTRRAALSAQLGKCSAAMWVMQWR